MSIRLVATDMDGTLLDSNKNLPKDFEKWVKEHKEIKTVIASGRQYYALVRDLKSLKDHLIFIAENGGLVFDNDEILYCDELSTQYVRDSIEIIKNIKDVSPVICGANSAYILNPTEADIQNASMYYARLRTITDIEEALSSDKIVKLALYVYNNKAEEKMPLFEALSDRIDVVLSGTSWIDFSNYSANKGNALSAIMKKYDIDKSEVMAFGDYLNDYSLLQACEESYCMANGHEELKKIAKHIALSNDEDGVMEVLRKI